MNNIVSGLQILLGTRHLKHLTREINESAVFLCCLVVPHQISRLVGVWNGKSVKQKIYIKFGQKKETFCSDALKMFFLHK